MSAAYAQDEVIFVGAYAEIVRARRVSDDAPVMIKRLRDTGLTSERIARLRHEHNILLILQRAKVRGVPVPVELLEQGGTFALVTHDIGGVALSVLRERQGLPERTVLAVGIQVARALTEVHGVQVTHKDINPRNVVYNAATEEAQLIDFGLASHAERGAATRPRMALEGTLTHMAPEQTGRIAVGVDARTDLYGLGALLYDLLTGRPPVLSQEQGNMIYEILTVAPPAPRSLVPGMAPALERILCKLLEKDPHARYRSAYGVSRDLERCAQELAKRGKIDDFAPAEHDRTETLDWPQALQGRQAELRALHEACQLTPVERTRIVLVTGGEGMGKSALLAAAREDAAVAHHALSALGTYEVHRAALRLHGLADALTAAVRQLLMGSKEKVDAWRRRMQEALGGIGRVAVDLIPTLAGLVGEQPAIQPLGAVQAENRLVTTLERCILALARTSPFVLYLDNLHLADASTVRLLAQLAAPNGERRALTLVLGYDPDHLDAESPLNIWLIALRSQRDAARVMNLAPLTAEMVAGWLTMTLHADAEAAAVRPLAEAVHRKTGGSPQAVRLLVQRLWQQHVLRFDIRSGSWTWDVAQVQQQPVTGNLVEGLKAALQELPEASRAVLACAACVGLDFELAVLLDILEQEVGALAASLQPAIDEGILVALERPGTLRFAHEALRATAEALLSVELRGKYHNQMAWRMDRNTPAVPPTGWVCELADHIGVAWQGKAMTMALTKAAYICHLASWRAQTSLNYAGALAYANQGLSILGDTPFNTHHDLAAALRYVQLIGYITLGQQAQTKQIVDDDVQRAANPTERASALWRYYQVLWLSGKYPEAVDALIRALALLGERVPHNPGRLALWWENFRFRLSLAARGRTAKSLIEAPVMTDPKQIQLFNPLRDMLLPSSMVRPLLTMWVAYRLARLTVEHGVQPNSAGAYTSLLTVACLRGDFKEARRWADIMRGLSDRATAPVKGMQIGNAKMSDRTYVEYFTILQLEGLTQNSQWVIDHYERLAAELIDAGDGATATLVYFGIVHTAMGVSLDRAVVLCARFEADAVVNTNPVALLHIRAVGASAKLMQGTLQVSGAERALLTQAAADKYVPEMAQGMHSMQAMLQLLSRNLDQALACLYAAGLEERNPTTMVSRLTQSPLVCMICSQYAIEHGGVMPPRAARLFKVFLEQLRLATRIKGTRHMGTYTALLAEQAAVRGRHKEAARLYALAVQQNERVAHSSHEAMCLELAGRFHARFKRRTLARVYITRACRAYESWGTLHKSRELQREFGIASVAAERGATGSRSSTVHSSVSTHPHEIDASATMALLQSINHRLANEFDQQLLSAKILTLAAEMVPESRVALVLRGTDGALRLQRDSAPDGAALPAIVLAEPAPSSMRVVTNVSVDVAATRDPYFGGWTSGFYVLAPIVHRGQVRGAIYCENADSFAYSLSTVARLDLLAGQVAVALENAAVYNTLEAQVELRTREARALQDRLNRMAINEAEVQMASGFAHEIRTAVASARFALSGLVRVDAQSPVNLHDDTLAALDRADAALAQDDFDAFTQALRGARELLGHEKDLLESVSEGMERAMVVTGQVLEYAEIGGVVAGDHRVALDSLVPELLSGLSADLRAHPIDLQVQVPAGLVLPLREEHAFAIVRNLLANARDAVLSKHGETEPRRIVLEAQAYQGKVEVTVSDTGVGMSTESQQRVFQPFFTTKGLHGTGLGLGLSRKLARLYGGELVFQSEEGKGTTFTLTVPVNEA